MVEKIKTVLRKNKFASKLIENYSFRTIVFSLGSFALGVAYAALNIFVAFAYRSVWFGALGCYYIMLGIIRGGVLLNRHILEKPNCKKDKTVCEIRQYFICGILLIAMTALLSAMVMHIARQSKTFEYSLSVIYMTAGYTFYRIAVSVYNFIKARKNDYTVRSLQCVNLAAALISFLSLQSAALTAFSTGVNQNIVNALTGGIVCILVVSLAVFMIADSWVHLVRSESVPV